MIGLTLPTSLRHGWCPEFLRRNLLEITLANKQLGIVYSCYHSMALSKLAAWNLFQGISYLLVTTLFMAYPKTADILNFSDVSFKEEDYKLCQTLNIAVFVIGIIFVEHGLSHWINTHIRPRLLGPSDIHVEDSVVFFTMISTWGRIILVPILVMIVLLTFGKGDVMLQALLGLFLVVDPLFGFMTLIILKKYGNEKGKSDLRAKHVAQDSTHNGESV